MTEIWKDIEGYEGLYQISDLGNVKSLTTGRNMKPQYHRNHLTVSLRKNKVAKTFFVHRLVAQAFVQNPYCKEEVHHKNSKPDDNRAVNLEWVTTEEHRELHTGNARSNIKLLRKKIFQFSVDGELIGIFDSVKTAANFLGCSESIIVDNLKGRSKVAHNSLWKYAP